MDDDRRSAGRERDPSRDGDGTTGGNGAAEADESADAGADRIDEAERRALLRRINRQGATIGAQIPEAIEVGGEELELAEFVVETRRVPGVPEEAESTLAAAKRTLHQELREREQRLESEPLTREAAEQLADEIVGIERALNALGNLRRPRFGEASGERRIRDYKQWLQFLGDVTD